MSDEVPAVFLIQSPSIELEAVVVQPDSNLLGFQVGQIRRIEVAANASANELSRAMSQFNSWRDQRQLRFVSARIGHELLNISLMLEDHGYRFIEMVYPLNSSQIGSAHYDASDILIESVTIDDLAGIEAIAESAFSTGRINIDPRLGPVLGGARYAGWVRNSFSDPKHRIVKACQHGEIVAFFIYEVREECAVYWHLTAVAPSRQGKGIGVKVWQAMIMHHLREGIARIGTTISAHNFRVINLYARLGFRFDAPQMTFHWVRG